MLFIIKSDPKVIAGDSFQFAREQARLSAKEVQSAQTRLDDATNVHGADPDDWSAATVITRAEENLEAIEAKHRAALLKLHWESNERWTFGEIIRREIAKAAKKTPSAFVRPWQDNFSEWLKCFQPRQIKPT